MENVYLKLEELSESRRQNLAQYLARFVLEHVEEIGDWSLAEFTGKVSCSKPTVLRFCRELGCVGFAEFKFKLKEYSMKKLTQDFDPTMTLSELPDSEYLKFAQKTFQEGHKFYQKQKKKVNRLINQIAEARLIYIFGMNMSYNFSKSFCDWLRLLGLNVIHEKDFDLIAGYLSNLHEDDIVICFSIEEMNSWLKRMTPKLKSLPNYKFGVLDLHSSFKRLFNDAAFLPEFDSEFWNSSSIRAQTFAQFLDYLYFDLSKVISLPK